jgi:hypothetical protein
MCLLPLAMYACTFHLNLNTRVTAAIGGRRGERVRMNVRVNAKISYPTRRHIVNIEPNPFNEYINLRKNEASEIPTKPYTLYPIP